MFVRRFCCHCCNVLRSVAFSKAVTHLVFVFLLSYSIDMEQFDGSVFARSFIQKPKKYKRSSRKRAILCLLPIGRSVGRSFFLYPWSFNLSLGPVFVCFVYYYPPSSSAHSMGLCMCVCLYFMNGKISYPNDTLSTFWFNSDDDGWYNNLTFIYCIALIFYIFFSFFCRANCCVFTHSI